LYIIVYF